MKVKRQQRFRKLWTNSLLHVTFLVTVTCMMGQGGLAQGEVEEIRIIGNNEIPTEAILSAMTNIKVGQPFSLEGLKQDLESIYELGWFSHVEADDPDVTSEGKVRITIRVVEYPKVTQIVFQGEASLFKKRLLKLMRTKEGEILNERVLRDDLTKISEYFKEKGYATSGPVPDFDASTGTMTIAVEVAKIVKVEFVGLKKTKPWVVRRELRSVEGTIYNEEILRRDYNTLINLGWFKNIDVKREIPPDSEEPGVHIRWEFQEQRTGQAMGGLAFSSRNEFVGSVGIQENNFRGRGERLRIAGEFIDRTGFDILYHKPWIDSKRTAVTFNIYSREFFRQPTSLLLAGITGTELSGDVDFSETRTGLSLLARRPIEENVWHAVGVRLEKVKFQQREFRGGLIARPVRGVKSDEGQISVFSFSRDEDTRDIFIDPKKGALNSFEVEAAMPFFGSNRFYQRVNLDIRRYLSFSKSDTFAARLLFGFGLGKLPVFENYFVGGAESLRGYQIDRFVGSRMLVLNLELRHRFTKELHIVPFIDIGDAFGGSNALDLKEAAEGIAVKRRSGFDPKIGYGIGLRVNTPFAPFRLDLGFGEDGLKTHFSIGPTF